MSNYKCGKCGSTKVFLAEKSTQTAIRCDNCGCFIKWASKNELALLKKDQPNQPSQEIQTDEDKELTEAAKTITALIRRKYGYDTQVIIKTDSVQIVQTKKEISLG